MTSPNLETWAGFWSLIGSIATVVGLVCGGAVWTVYAITEKAAGELQIEMTSLIGRAIAEHAAEPHPVTLVQAGEHAAELVRQEHRLTQQLTKELRVIERKQVRFTTDIAEIKRQLDRIEDQTRRDGDAS